MQDIKDAWIFLSWVLIFSKFSIQITLWKISIDMNDTVKIVDLEGGKFFFNTVREGDSVLFATEDEQVKLVLLYSWKLVSTLSGLGNWI